MKHLCMIVIHLIHITSSNALTFVNYLSTQGPIYVTKESTMLLRWRIRFTKKELQNDGVYFRLEKLIHERRNNSSAYYLEKTHFHKLTISRNISSTIAYVKIFEHNLYGIGFNLGKMQIRHAGRYRLFIKTAHLDYFSFSQIIVVYEPPLFTNCLNNIRAFETSSNGITQLHIKTYCKASGYPKPVISCQFPYLGYIRTISNTNHKEYIIEPWPELAIHFPMIRCFATYFTGKKYKTIMKSKSYFLIIRDPIAPYKLKQLQSKSKVSIQLQWKMSTLNENGGKLRNYIVKVGDNTFALDPPKPSYKYQTDVALTYYSKADYVYYRLFSLKERHNYTVSVQSINEHGRGSPISSRTMLSGFQFEEENKHLITSKHITKSTTLIVTTIALATLLILLLLAAIIHRKKVLERWGQRNFDQPLPEQSNIFTTGTYSEVYVLPSYDEAVLSNPIEAPPSFDVITSQLEINNTSANIDTINFSEEPTGLSPPPYPGHAIISV